MLMNNINEPNFESAILTKDKKLTENRKNIIELFEGYNDEYIPIEVDWGGSVGKELF